MNRCMKIKFPPFNHMQLSSLASLEAISYWETDKDLLPMSRSYFFKTKHPTMKYFEELYLCNSSFILHTFFVSSGGISLYVDLILQARDLWPYFPYLKQKLSNRLFFSCKKFTFSSMMTIMIARKTIPIK